jgi:hypothetical protein
VSVGGLAQLEEIRKRVHFLSPRITVKKEGKHMNK